MRQLRQHEHRLGIIHGLRPDEPITGIGAPCQEYKDYTTYALNLKEAYRTRTTQNRMWLYVAGITGLGVAAASGALAAATAVAAGTLALLAISGGFAAASFATIDNSELANVYNMAANQIGTALAEAESERLLAPANCAAPLAELVTAVSDARNELETARTNSAAGALIRARAGRPSAKNLMNFSRISVIIGCSACIFCIDCMLFLVRG